MMKQDGEVTCRNLAYERGNAAYAERSKMDLYRQIFKRKSFHLFRDTKPISEEKLKRLREFISQAMPLDSGIRIEIRIVPEARTSCKRGAEYCIMFYSEPTGNYLQNIGYIGEQIDLYLASENIGALWYGVGRTGEQVPGLEFIIMIAIAEVSDTQFRRDMFRAKRKPMEEVWCGDTLGVGEIVRFAPSACNSQPWITEYKACRLKVTRIKKPGKRGIMPASRVAYYNRIDMGIYLLFLELCLAHEKYVFERKLLPDGIDADHEITPMAEYRLISHLTEQNDDCH